MTRKTKFFHLKNKTFLEAGPRTQNKHSYQAATTIINCKSKVLFLLLLSLRIKTFFKLLAQNKILFCSYLFPWSRLTEFTAQLKHHQTLELGLGVEIIGPQQRGNSPLSPPWYHICLPTATMLLLPSLLLLMELYPSFYNKHFSLLFQRKETLKSWQSSSYMNHFSSANTFTVLSGYLL